MIMKKDIVIGYISPTNPEVDRMSWSGTFYNTYHAIQEAGYKVEWVPYNVNRFLNKVGALAYKLNYGIGSYDHSTYASEIHTKSLKKNRFERYDYLFIPAQSEIIAGIRTDVPIIHYSDATFDLMLNYYWFNYSEKAIEEGNKIEKQAIQKSKYLFAASEWAASSVVKKYHADSKNVFIFPLGADVPKEHVNSKLPEYKTNKLKLLFSGKDWKRKGGRLAVKAVEYLNKKGIKTDLYIVGVSDLQMDIKRKDYIHLEGFLDKNNEDDYVKYLMLYHECNALLLPTRAECAGIVFSEANGFKMPSFTTDTGGIGTYVHNGINGYRLPLSATGEEFGKCIEKIYREKRFKELSDGAYSIYQNSTSWDSWSRRFRSFVENIRYNTV